MSDKNSNLKDFFKAIVSLKSEEDCISFFSDICTEIEVEQMATRLFAAKLLAEGKKYEDIIRLTGLSSTTLSRVSKCLKRGGGYRYALGLKPIDTDGKTAKSTAKSTDDREPDTNSTSSNR